MTSAKFVKSVYIFTESLYRAKLLLCVCLFYTESLTLGASKLNFGMKDHIYTRKLRQIFTKISDIILTKLILDKNIYFLMIFYLNKLIFYYIDIISY